MIRMASMEVSGKAALQANSDRHLMASWNEGMEARKWFLKIRSERERERERKVRKRKGRERERERERQTCGFEGHLHNGGVSISSCQVEHREYVLPP